MPHRLTSITTLTLALCVAISVLALPRRGGRYDPAIRSKVADLLRSKADYQKVRAKVEDGIVTLTGSVELDSTRRWVVDRVRGMDHVAGVNSRLVLKPPAVPDQTLYGRVRRNLNDAGFQSLELQVHEGAVKLSGGVTNERERQHAIQVARNTAGVKEVESTVTAPVR
ncbi:MAG TPA: BON domain-containing protein [Candidatus Angelobacter sp.]|nr:BON domain-containing protein [Candidatus Angelobacter sp.]